MHDLEPQRGLRANHDREEDYLRRVFRKLDVESHVVEMLQSGFQNTWVTVDGAPQVLLTSGGTPPGDPWADMTFVLICCTALSEIHSELEAQGLIQQVS